MVELAAFNREVVGSNPTGCTNKHLRSSMVELAALNREVATTNADGVIFYLNEYEESASWDYPSQNKSLKEQGKKTLYLAKMKWPMSKNEDFSDKLAAFAADMKGGK